jgi:hypothetical protein
MPGPLVNVKITTRRIISGAAPAAHINPALGFVSSTTTAISRRIAGNRDTGRHRTRAAKALDVQFESIHRRRYVQRPARRGCSLPAKLRPAPPRAVFRPSGQAAAPDARLRRSNALALRPVIEQRFDVRFHVKEVASRASLPHCSATAGPSTTPAMRCISTGFLERAMKRRADLEQPDALLLPRQVGRRGHQHTGQQ